MVLFRILFLIRTCCLLIHLSHTILPSSYLSSDLNFLTSKLEEAFRHVAQTN